MQEVDCPPAASKPKFQVESIDFSDIPGQSKLFVQYQKDPLSLKKYYPSAVSSHVDLTHRIGDVLGAYTVDRKVLCDILARQNERFGAGKRTVEHIDLLGRDNTVAILTGQQAGLFTGPLYTIYKALSAIKMAACFRNRGINAVPVFWAATEDHDFEEVAAAFLSGNNGERVGFRLDSDKEFEGHPVGTIPIPESFAHEFRDKIDDILDSEFKDEIIAGLSEIWQPGQTLGNAFCSHLQRIFKDHGLIVVDPLDSRLKELASPIYKKATEKAGEIVPALIGRSRELAAEGFHSQVLVTEDYFPLFFHTDDGVRRSVRLRTGNVYRVNDTVLEFTREQLAGLTETEPDRFSPGVMLRSVVQDYLFPTACYLGGGAEIAYFAQSSEVYRILDRPVTPILHRQSFTVVEPKQERILDKFELEFPDLFSGFDSLIPGIVERFVNPKTSRLFADAEEKINVELNRLEEELSQLDPTLGQNLATRRRKINYHIGALRTKFQRMQIERDATVNRQLRSLFDSLLPDGQLQERKINIANFLARYGPYFTKWVYDSIDLDDRGHRLLYLK